MRPTIPGATRGVGEAGQGSHDLLTSIAPGISTPRGRTGPLGLQPTPPASAPKWLHSAPLVNPWTPQGLWRVWELLWSALVQGLACSGGSSMSHWCLWVGHRTACQLQRVLAVQRSNASVPCMAGGAHRPHRAGRRPSGARVHGCPSESLASLRPFCALVQRPT